MPSTPRRHSKNSSMPPVACSLNPALRNLLLQSRSPSSRDRKAHLTAAGKMESRNLPPVAAAASFCRSSVVLPSLGRPAMMLTPSVAQGSQRRTGAGRSRSSRENADSPTGRGIESGGASPFGFFFGRSFVASGGKSCGGSSSLFTCLPRKGVEFGVGICVLGAAGQASPLAFSRRGYPTTACDGERRLLLCGWRVRDGDAQRERDPQGA